MRNRPIKVLDIRDSPWVDGPGRTILQCASQIDPQRCKILIGVFVQELGDNNEYYKSAENLKLQVMPLTEKRRFDIGLIKQILKIIENEEVQVIHTHEFRSNMYGLLCAKLTNTPVISTCHGWIANSWRRRLVTRLDRFFLRFFNQVIAVSGFMRSQLEGFGVKPEKIEVIKNALVTDHYPGGIKGTGFREDLGVGKDKVLVGNIGRLSREKGQDFLLRAVKEILTSRDDLYLVFVGIGPEEGRLRDLSRKLGIEKNVRFAGFQNDMVYVYRSLDLVVQSSHTEGMPNVILESLLMEVPVVATSVGGTAEAMAPVSAGILIEAGRKDQLADGINRYLADPSSHQKMAQRGREYVLEHFSQNKRLRLLTELYEKIIMTLPR